MGEVVVRADGDGDVVSRRDGEAEGVETFVADGGASTEGGGMGGTEHGIAGGVVGGVEDAYLNKGDGSGLCLHDGREKKEQDEKSYFHEW